LKAESRRPAQGTDSDKTTRANKSLDDKIAHVPRHRPWARRPDAAVIERRFRIDQRCWRRRIDAARRLSHDARDELVAPYHGRWTG
jgi:hypothetical protein